MDRQDRARTTGCRLLDESRVDPQAVLLDVDEAGHRALVQEAVRRGDEAERRRDHLIAVADPQRAHGEVESRGAARAGNSLAATGQAGHACLESFVEWAHRKRIAREDLGDELELAGADVGPGERDRSFDGRPGCRHRFAEGSSSGDPSTLMPGRAESGATPGRHSTMRPCRRDLRPRSGGAARHQTRP